MTTDQLSGQLFAILAMFCLCCSLLMDIGHNQQQHPTLDSGGVSRVPCRLPAHTLPLTLRSLSAPLLLFVEIFFQHFLWTLFVDTLMDTFCGTFLWTLFCGHFLWTLFVNSFCGQFCGQNWTESAI